MSTLYDETGLTVEQAAAEIHRLRAINSDLLAALERMMRQPTMSPINMTPAQRKELWDAHADARAAIAKATGGTGA